MVVTWVSLLKTVPWTDVIANAPAITDGARKLWNTVARKPTAGGVGGAAEASAKDATAAAAATSAAPHHEVILQLQARLDAVNATVADLQGQMLASSELIKALADQNTELIARVEVHRRRLLWLSGAVAMTAAVVAGHLILAYLA
ncbi:MAG: hypothetical protein EOP40_02625 [Rubrivivax sp.]|nr:MAG: hypothetical protein EOP40_02625 [Rubrivivax sp.]